MVVMSTLLGSLLASLPVLLDPAQCGRRVRLSRKCFLPTNLNTLSSQCRLCVGLFSMMTLGAYTLILLRKMIPSLHNCIHENFDSFH